MVYIDMDKPTECGGCPMLLEDDQCCLQRSGITSGKRNTPPARW